MAMREVINRGARGLSAAELLWMARDAQGNRLIPDPTQAALDAYLRKAGNEAAAAADTARDKTEAATAAANTAAQNAQTKADQIGDIATAVAGTKAYRDQALNAAAPLTSLANANPFFTVVTGVSGGILDATGRYIAKRTGSDYVDQYLGSTVKVAEQLAALDAATVTLSLTGTTIGGILDLTGRYVERRTTADRIDAQLGSMSAAAARIEVLSPIKVASAAGGTVDATGRYIGRPLRAGDTPIPARYALDDLLYDMQAGKPARQAIDQDRALWVGTAAGVATTDSGVKMRIPLLYVIPGTRRILAMVQLRDASGNDDAGTGIALKVGTIGDAGAVTWSAERVVATTDASEIVAQYSVVHDPLTGRLWLLMATLPVGFTEATVRPPSVNAGAYMRVRSLYSDDPLAALTFRRSDGSAWIDGTGVSQAALEDLARDAVTPFWNVCPGAPGIAKADSGELLIGGNAAGVAGGTGAGNIGLTGTGFLYAFDRTAQKWRWRGATPLMTGTNEARIVEKRDGTIRMEARHHYEAAGRYVLVHEYDPTATRVIRSYVDQGRPDARSEGAILRLSGGPGRRGMGVLVSAAVAGAAVQAADDRHGLTLWVSTDEGETWPFALRVYPDAFTAAVDLRGAPLAGGPAAITSMTGYVSLARLTDDTIGLLFEGRPARPDGTAAPVFSTMSWLTLNLASITRSYLP